jgi:hypothetical protein
MSCISRNPTSQNNALDRVAEIRSVLSLFEGGVTGAVDGWACQKGGAQLELGALGSGSLRRTMSKRRYL